MEQSNEKDFKTLDLLFHKHYSRVALCDVQMYIPRRLGIDKRRNLDKSCVQAQSPGSQYTYS